MRAISVDLNWKPEGEAAVVEVDGEGRATWGFYTFPEELVDYTAKLPDSLVLLDIPIYGLDALGDSHFRPVDKALQSVGIPLRPSTSAGRLGIRLARRITSEAGVPASRVREIYPYAVYKWLAYLRDRGSLTSLTSHIAIPLLQNDFKIYWPLPYKRNSKRGTRRQGMEELYALLIDPDIGLQFQTPLPPPDGGAYSQKRLTDIYDAALGAVLGLHLLRADGWAVVLGDTESGDLALLADTWLAERLNSYLSTDRPTASNGGAP
jgi:predicted nuclease with RNAse H fold